MPTFKISNLRTFLLVTAASTTIATLPALAADEEAITLSANAAIVSDYRFRGVSLSDKDPAIQGGFDVSTSSGFYVGTWGSSIENFEGSEFELDIYAGYGTTFGELDFDVGLLAYTYPGSSDTTYLEAYTSIGGSAGVVGWTLGAAYAFDQDNIGGDDNIYLYLDAGAPLGDTPLSVGGHIGYEDGAFGSDKWDWSLGLTYDFKQFSLGVNYVDTNVDGRTTKGGVVASLSASF